MRATWIADVLRGEGLRVLELAGWKTRETRPGFDPVGIVCHHTATGPNVPNVNVRNLLRDGRSDLTGPLSQLGLERDGLFVTVAAGRCNHNGYGQWGNDSIGIEAYNDGQGEPWPDVQVDAYHRGAAAICRHQGWGPSQVLGHKETDPDRKIDPAGLSMPVFRASVSRLLLPEDDDEMTPAQEAKLDRILEHLERLDPWPPELLNVAGEKDPKGRPAARQNRWLSEVLKRTRTNLPLP